MGVGVIGLKRTYFEPMSKHNGIFHAEIYATDRCASFNLEKNYGWLNIAFLTDSQSAIKELRLNQGQYLGKLNTLDSFNKIRIL